MLLKNLLPVPPYTESQAVETAWWLNIVLLIFTIVIVLMGFVIPLLAEPTLLNAPFLLSNLGCLVAIGGARLLVQKGRVRFAAILVVFSLFFAVTYVNLSSFRGLPSPNLLAYFVLIPLAGLLLGKQFMLRFAILCVAAVGMTFYLESANIVVLRPKLRPTWDDVLVWFLGMAFNTILLTAMIRRSEESAKTATQAMNAAVGANEELQKSQRQLEAALQVEKELNELKSRFVSMASHEFRTPLTTILLQTETLTVYRHKLTDEQIGQRLTKISEQVGYLKTIIEDVLQLARLQAGRAEFQPEPLALDPFCLSIIEEYQSHPDVTHQLVYRCHTPPPVANMDKRLMRQVISNLISNAIKYSPAEKPITIELIYNGAAIVLQVRDQGIGIPEADLKYLFQPFHRAANVGVTAGTGLGLVIAQESVTMHGGTIIVESKEKVGTTVTVKIPIVTALSAAPEAAASR
ncbi:MAG: HAMP domain-containing histidine kinase [Caldilineaceae bacterium]|nr:HAMP domain-containing histidine kinase [Caldilineaceae bacterium]